MHVGRWISIRRSLHAWYFAQLVRLTLLNKSVYLVTSEHHDVSTQPKINPLLLLLAPSRANRVSCETQFEAPWYLRLKYTVWIILFRHNIHVLKIGFPVACQ